MNFAWGADPELKDVHPLSCPVWTSDEPCTCTPKPRVPLLELLEHIHPVGEEEQ